ncbi:DUF4446 domain-containing protein [Kyrpidia spormannii]|uniref:DUF4446 domain-containing protein n=1 Tax=Kyrpidia spormannii TaxID=2055160 RepID=A0A2K8NDG9_9BACL|nr:DUF4446 family protein [Kyrpidia spormannii]ATY86312.1 DUF4446 domain-containing protein [Kyrpidia spormannii]
MYSSIAAIPLWYWVAAIGILVVLLWLTVLIQGAGLRKTQKRYRQWVGRSGTDVEKLLPQTLERIQQLSEEVRRLEARIDYLEKSLRATLRTARVVRYNAFSDFGSDLSFSAAWLDGSGNGVILSSIYGRDESRIYAKPVQNGTSTYPLSEEEKRVLAEAIQFSGASDSPVSSALRPLEERS